MNDKTDVNTKDALLAAAIEVFADKGFDAATVRDICGKANANVAAVNYHYGGKDALYVAALEQVFPMEEHTDISTDTSLEPEERLRVYLTMMVDEIYERGNGMVNERWAIFLREMAKPSPNLDFIVHRQVEPRANELREIVAAILGPDTPDQVLAFSSSNIWAMMLDHVLTQPILDRLSLKRPAVKGNRNSFVQHLVRFALGGLNAVKGQN
ncbi:TetR/AcrR family transcriptional regulator [Pseudodesulfovibrio piezophilus]|uniref:Transcriptional regulator, TetR family n=1 Tax=Pseudodesulfovibrio piezophilus (strain DSM 21447 / JCM 15486 / C1TLV30) TaxID=1322246 RepID=M1WQ06_PSEP2|nr:TetR/AcrR family transcriptional regulator [Pseudodesulfovibrio piezophilus]CCH48709.1 Transcriptional regulator, TetR family [Pseudodesulfovibrio piezophilus C1TLV30]